MKKGNIKNLISFNQMTKEKQKEISKKGGLASAKSRIQRKLLKESVKAILDLKPTQTEIDLLAKNGIYGDDLTKNEIVALSLYLQAVKGNIQAIIKIMEIQDEQDSTTKQDTTDIIQALNNTAKKVWK